MKAIGRTVDYNPIVELTQEEHRLLVNLSRVMSGAEYTGLWISDDNGNVPELDLTPAFKAIITFATGKALINSIKHLTNQLDEVFMHDTEGTAPEE